GVDGDAELAGGDTGRSMCKVVRVRVERSQMRTLLRKQINGSLLRFAVDAHVGDGIEPDLCGRVNGAEVGQFEPMQEILGLLQIEWVIFVILGAILVCDGDAIADWCSLLAAARRPD
ncbi:MAG TPA: hypothetical protein VJ255_14845, partial [Candidatus Acidoferrum sp.]|nr:hypothetical protein [Candidatus Acidoferrum sp.]